jgi:hypothetical protein
MRRRCAMRILIRLLFSFIYLILAGSAFTQDQTYQKIQLKDWDSVQSSANVAVWRTDYYICTGIAYAKTLGKTTDDFTHFVGNAHSWDGISEKDLPAAVQILYGLIRLYENGKFKILSESDTLVTMLSNRPYKPYFSEKRMLSVTIDEFERCLWGHIAILAERRGLDFKYKIKDDEIISSLKIKK